MVGSNRKIYIEERNGRKCGKLDLDLGTLTWVEDRLNAAADASFSMGSWQRKKLDFGIIFFQVLENIGRRFTIISLDSFKGRKARVFISEGSRESGWRSLAREILNMGRRFTIICLDSFKGRKARAFI